MLRRRRLRGDHLEKLLGHLTFVFLLRRPFLSVFNAVYKFVRFSYTEASVMWKTVRDELECARGLLPLVRADWKAAWTPRVFAPSACEEGWPRDRV